MSQGTLEFPVLGVQQAEAEAVFAAAEHAQQGQAAADMAERVSAASSDVLGSLGLDEFRDAPISSPHGTGESYTLGEVIDGGICTPFANMLASMHKSLGEGAVKVVVQAEIKKAMEAPKPEAVQKIDTPKAEKPKKTPHTTAEQKPIEAPTEQPKATELQPIVVNAAVTETPPAVLPVQQKIETTTLPEMEPAPVPLEAPLPLPVVIPAPRPAAELPESFFIETAIPQPVIENATEAAAIPVTFEAKPTQQPAEADTSSDATLSEAEPILLPLSPAETEADAEMSAAEFVPETTAEPATEISEMDTDILPAEPIDLSAEVNALLIELGLSTGTAPEVNYDASEAVPEGALQLPQLLAVEAETSAEVQNIDIPVQPVEELPAVLQTELAERIETLTADEAELLRPAAEALLQAAVEVNEIQLLPTATVEQQIAAREKLEELCVDLLEALGLPADDETVKQFSRCLLQTEQFRSILHVGLTQQEAGTHERKRGDMTWLQQLVRFIQTQLEQRHHVLGWSALQLSAPQLLPM